MPAINVPAAPAKAVFINALRDRKLSSGSTMGCELNGSSLNASAFTSEKGAGGRALVPIP
jgi:hypothetical protein